MTAPRVLPLGDAALAVDFGAEFSDRINARVIALADSLRASPPGAALRDIVPGIASLTVHFDPASTDIRGLITQLEQRAALDGDGDGARQERDRREPRVHELRVIYGGAGGPDLEDVASFAGISAAEVIARHAARVYRVYMLGFLPGFAYLGQVDPAIAAPRRSTPRQAVPAGSVGIAGRQTGVYPQVSPGGWQLIGRTGARMFDMTTGRSLLEPGDGVRFVPERT